MKRVKTSRNKKTRPKTIKKVKQSFNSSELKLSELNTIITDCLIYISTMDTFDFCLISFQITANALGFNGSLNISENCDFRSQYGPFYIIL